MASLHNWVFLFCDVRLFIQQSMEAQGWVVRLTSRFVVISDDSLEGWASDIYLLVCLQVSGTSHDASQFVSFQQNPLKRGPRNDATERRSGPTTLCLVSLFSAAGTHARRNKISAAGRGSKYMRQPHAPSLAQLQSLEAAVFRKRRGPRCSVPVARIQTAYPAK
jgi:hypothetical protein